MNMLYKLDYLMQENRINKRQLAVQANIPYTTIDGLYKRGYENIKLQTLKKLANYFGVSMEYLTNDKIPINAEKSFRHNEFSQVKKDFFEFIDSFDDEHVTRVYELVQAALRINE